MPPLVTRFAPSPTGHLHIGGARTALFCWAFAKKSGGRFMLRIEDTDAARSSLESARGIIEDLHWLGIVNDLGPFIKPDGSIGQHDWEPNSGRPPVGEYFQARRVAIYNAYLERLITSGRAYPAFDTNEETEKQRAAAVAAKQTYRYPRPADIEFGQYTPAMQERWKRAQAGERHVVRFAAPNEEIVVHDEVLGDVRYAPGEMDDFVIRKADGFPTYHFAVVIDDETMGVTHVLRAQEHLNNTPRHVALQKALTHPDGTAFRILLYAHMPIICNMDASKMSKRDKAKAARKALKEYESKSKPDKPQMIIDLTRQLMAKAKAEGTDNETASIVTLLPGFLAGDNDNVQVAEALAAHFKIALPEIEVWDFKKNGYLPEAICNFVALLGWNPGLKTPDGKDLEKFDNAFLASHFGLDRIGKTASKFDRNKLLSFNADAINGLSDEEFAKRWRIWCVEFEPVFAARVDANGRWIELAKAVKARAKTLRDGVKASAFVLRDDHAADFDPAAVEKNLKANGNQGLTLLRTVFERLQTVDAASWNAATLHALIEQVGQQDGTGLGPVSQAIRVAIAGAAVSPPLGESLAVLGRGSALKRIETCLSVLST
ncbi:MAG: glutamate--tRNA ligase [Phycisphaerales bacterium]|nr:glutamate--tRNA ligase [Phycisphaerales bacterium]